MSNERMKIVAMMKEEKERIYIRLEDRKSVV